MPSEPVSHSLKDQLKESLPASVNISSGGGGGGESVPDKAPQAVHGDVKAQVPKIADEDNLLNAGKGEIGSSLSSTADLADDDPTKPDSLFLTEEVTLTEEERDQFLQALITGQRYEQSFTIYGGAIKGIFRGRATEESEAIAAWLNAGFRAGKYTSMLEYAIAVRNTMLAAQVKELGGTRFTEFKAPLYKTVDGDKVTEPGWLAQADHWSTEPEPVVAALYEALKLFERKYWTMVAHANDQNFWHPVESTSR